MKANKKVVLTTAVVVGAAALVAGGTIAYFTDHETETNEFTVANAVDIELFESQLHRQNSGRGGYFPGLASDPDYCDWEAAASVQTSIGDSRLISGSYENARYCTPEHDISANSGDSISAVVNGHTKASRNWGYTDAEIEADAETYKDTDDDTTLADESGYFTRASQNIVPGQWVRKFSYVKNTDNSGDAYVLIRYMVPTEYADLVELKIPGTPYEEDEDSETAGVQAYFLAVEKGADGYSAYELTDNGVDDYIGYTETIDNTEYKVYAAVTRQAIEPGEMTFWSPINVVRLASTVDANDTAALNQIDVKVDAQAIQARPFLDAIDAINHL